MASEIFYRKFKNMDPAGIAEVWNQSGYANLWGDPIQSGNLEQLVFSKLFFDPEFLIVAVERRADFKPKSPWYDGEIIGFVHGGFAPDFEKRELDKSEGFIALLAVKQMEGQEEKQEQVRAGLLYEIEKKFKSIGISRVHAGAVYPNAPFYSNLLYGCELNGILENDPFLPPLLLQKDYTLIERYHSMQFVLDHHLTLPFAMKAKLRPLDFIVQTEDRLEGLNADWWSSRVFPSSTPLNQCMLMQKDSKKIIARVGFRKITKPTGALLALHHLFVEPEYRKQQYAKLLMYKTLEFLYHTYPNERIEILIPEKKAYAFHIFLNCKFEIISTGSVYLRVLPEDFPLGQEGVVHA